MDFRISNRRQRDLAHQPHQQLEVIDCGLGSILAILVANEPTTIARNKYCTSVPRERHGLHQLGPFAVAGNRFLKFANDLDGNTEVFFQKSDLIVGVFKLVGTRFPIAGPGVTDASVKNYATLSRSADYGR